MAAVRVLFVCTANICRSPAAEALARQKFGELGGPAARAGAGGHGFVFRSAGFLRSGDPSPALLGQALADHGVDISAHRSYLLDEASLDAADLVLTMEGEHVQRATLLHRAAFPKILPLREAAAVMTELPEAEITVGELLDEVRRRRDPSSYLSTMWDVEDPYNRKLKDYKRAVSEIGGLLDTVFGRLR